MKGQDRADRRAGDRQDDHRSARSAAQERHPAGAHDEDDERLGGERLDEPARTELAVPGVQHDEPSTRVASLVFVAGARASTA
jgi:hypothetical protein